MERLIRNVKKELEELTDNGINANNLQSLAALADVLKDLYESKCMEEKGEEQMKWYRDDGYSGDDYFGRDGYPGRGNDGSYGRRGVPGSGRGRGGYSGNGRMREYLDRVIDGMDMYEYGRDRYQHGDNEQRMYEGLEKLMYAICTFVESAMDFAETSEEKEIIRKHIQKLKSL